MGTHWNMFTWNICFLLDKSSCNFEICFNKDLFSVTNFSLCKVREIQSLHMILSMKYSLIIPIEKTEIRQSMAWSGTSRRVSLLRLMSNIASACFSDKQYSAKETMKIKLMKLRVLKVTIITRSYYISFVRSRMIQSSWWPHINMWPKPYNAHCIITLKLQMKI